MATPLLKEYFELQAEIESKYADKGIVLIQVGKFYETYQIDYEKHSIGTARKVSELLNIRMTKKSSTSKMKTAENAPYMTGFPYDSAEKQIMRLIERGYTVATYNQYVAGTNAGKPIVERRLDKIQSPGTNLNSNSITNFIMAISIEVLSSGKILANMAAIDITTGETKVYEAHGSRNETIENVNRFLNSMTPKEIIIAVSERSNKNILERLKFNDSAVVHTRVINKVMKKLSYQETFLDTVFDSPENINVIDHLKLERHPDLIIILVFLIDFVYAHDATISKKLRTVEHFNDDAILILNDDSLYQLNLCNRNEGVLQSCLLDILNDTRTVVGRRELQRRILFPSTSSSEINKRYDQIEYMQSDNTYTEVRKLLRGIPDLERWHRKILFRKCSPADLQMMREKYVILIELFDSIDGFFDAKTMKKIKKIAKFVEILDEYFTFRGYNSLSDSMCIKRNVFNKEIFPEIDELAERKEELYNKLVAIVNKIEDATEIRPDICFKEEIKNVARSKRASYYMSTTKTRAKKIATWATSKYMEFDFDNTGSKSKITSEKFRNISKEIIEIEETLHKTITETFHETVEEIYTINANLLQKVVSCLAEIDIAACNAKLAIKRAYHRPSISEEDTKTNSYLSIKKLRHPMIELMTEYQTNDVSLDSSGLLIYGLNSSGKSSILRAVGLAIVMAQAGLFVAAKKMKFQPYSVLFSKISKSDNIFTGKSLFAAEMTELNSMLSYANENSLILVDELCSSSEHVSATSLVAAALKWFSNSGTSFMISTHFHELSRLSIINTLENLHVVHFAVSIEDGELVYDRSLREGSGDTLYGIEIASLLGLNKEFIKDAFEVRAELEGVSNVILSEKRSKYNKDVYMHECEICGGQPKSVGPLETHHKRFQCEADSSGIIDDTFHKDVKWNLQILCKKCHSDLHVAEKKK